MTINKHFRNTWNVSGLSDCSLTRIRFAKGSPCNHDEYCSETKNGIEIRKNHLWWKIKQAGDRRLLPFAFARKERDLSGAGVSGRVGKGCGY